jgi:hypothetical protein
MKLKTSFLVLVIVFFTSCSNKPTLQQYFVDNSEKKDFVVFDISPSILNIDETKLTVEQKNALNSFDKMNVLAFKVNDTNKTNYLIETNKIKQILKNNAIQELMRMGSGKDAASVSFIGSEDNIEELILYGKKADNGFVIVRVLGENMNPNNVMSIVSILKYANIDKEQLKPLESLLKIKQ